MLACLHDIAYPVTGSCFAGLALRLQFICLESSFMTHRVPYDGDQKFWPGGLVMPDLVNCSTSALNLIIDVDVKQQFNPETNT